MALPEVNNDNLDQLWDAWLEAATAGEQVTNGVPTTSLRTALQRYFVGQTSEKLDPFLKLADEAAGIRPTKLMETTTGNMRVHLAMLLAERDQHIIAVQGQMSNETPAQRLFDAGTLTQGAAKRVTFMLPAISESVGYVRQGFERQSLKTPKQIVGLDRQNAVLAPPSRPYMRRESGGVSRRRSARSLPGAQSDGSLRQRAFVLDGFGHDSRKRLNGSVVLTSKDDRTSTLTVYRVIDDEEGGLRSETQVTAFDPASRKLIIRPSRNGGFVVQSNDPRFQLEIDGVTNGRVELFGAFKSATVSGLVDAHLNVFGDPIGELVVDEPVDSTLEWSGQIARREVINAERTPVPPAPSPIEGRSSLTLDA